jgi:hypothetical protein
MMAASEWLRPTVVPPTAIAPELPGNEEFCWLTTPLSLSDDQEKAAAPPPHDSFYDGMTDIERVFAVDYALLHRRHVYDTRFWVGNCTLQIVLQTITFAVPEHWVTTVSPALIVVLFTYLLVNRLVSHRPMWHDMAGRHVALTTSGTIRYDHANAVPVPTTDHVRFCCFCC